MFEYIKGEVVLKNVKYVAIDVNGIAYKIYISLKTYESISQVDAKLFIFTNIKEDAFDLYGFYTEEEREVFKILVNSNGVGPKLAIAVLSTFSTNELKSIISQEDIKLLTKVPGLGIKKAQKLMLDIRDKIDLNNITKIESQNSGIKQDIILALNSLGYNDKDLKKVINEKELNEFDNLEDAIKLVLKRIHSGK